MSRRESRTRYAVLGALSIEPMSGSEVHALASGPLAHFWHEGFGQIYPTLHRLEAEGHVVTSAGAVGIGSRRRVHELTASGWSELREWLARPVGPVTPGRDELLLKVFFGRHVAPEVLAGHVRARRDLLAASLGRYAAIEAELAADASPDAPWWGRTLQHGVAATSASLAWCESTLAGLAERGGGRS